MKENIVFVRVRTKDSKNIDLNVERIESISHYKNDDTRLEVVMYSGTVHIIMSTYVNFQQLTKEAYEQINRSI